MSAPLQSNAEHNGSNTSTMTVTLAGNTTTGSQVIVAVGSNTGTTVSSITSGGFGVTTWAKAKEQANGSSGCATIMYGKVDTTVSASATVNFSAKLSSKDGHTFEIGSSDIAASSPLDQTGANTGATGTTPTVTAAGANAQTTDVVVAIHGSQSPSTSTPTDYSTPTNIGNATRSHSCYKFCTAGETSQATWGSTAGGAWAGVIATFLPAAAAAGQPTMRRWGGVPHVGGYQRSGDGGRSGPWS